MLVANLPIGGSDSIDPSTNKKLICKIVNNKIYVYSIGNDKIDNGGLFKQKMESSILAVQLNPK
jgi:hypothetical protein